MAATPPHQDRMMDAYRPSPELLHACALLMARLKAGDSEALLKEDLQHVTQWLKRESVHPIPESARYHSD